MPNNICNSFLPMTKNELITKPLKTNKKLDKVCADIKKGVIKKRGWNVVSMLLGKMQNVAYPATVYFNSKTQEAIQRVRHI